MVLKKHHGALNQKNNLSRRQAAAANPTTTPPAPTPLPDPVISITTTHPAQPLTALPTPSKLLPPLLQTTVFSVSTLTSDLAPTLSSISTPLNSSTSALPSTLAPSTPPIVAAITSTGATPSVTTSGTTGSTNTGVLVGAIVGGCAALGLIVACVYLLLRRRRQNKKRCDEAFDTSDFRRSAILLDGDEEKQGGAQLLNRIERHVQSAPLSNTPVHQQNHHVSAAEYQEGERGQFDDPFTTQPSRGAAHRGPYGAQSIAYTYPPHITPYCYNNPHGYPPQARYPPQPQYAAPSQQYDVAPPSHYVHSETSPPFARQYDAIPSPAHYARSETSLLHHSEPGTPAVATAHDAASAIQDRNSIEDDEDAPPPAYEITETFVNHRPDVKTRHLTYDAASSISASGSLPAPASASTSAGPSTEPPSPFFSSAGPYTEPPSPFFSSAGPYAEPPSPLFSGPSRHHTLSSRPVSGTSAVTIVYE